MNIEHRSNTTFPAKQYESDIEAIIAKRYDNGADFWTTPDKRIGKGGPFSTLYGALMLAELGLTAIPIMKDVAELIFSLWRDDGHFQIAPKGGFILAIPLVSQGLCVVWDIQVITG